MPEVSVARGPLLKAWRAAEYQELWLEFRPRGVRDVLEVVTTAVEQANVAMTPLGLFDDVYGTVASDWPGGVAICLDRAATQEAVLAWLESFADQLTGAGLDGRVTTTPQKYLPMWLSDLSLHPAQLMAFVSYSTVDLTGPGRHERQTGWHVDEQTTSRIARMAIDWGSVDGSDTYFVSNHYSMKARADVAEPLARSLGRSGLARVTRVRARPTAVTSCTFVSQGRTGYQVWNDQRSWSERLDDLVMAMTALPDKTYVAFVQYAPLLSLSWMNVDWCQPPLPVGHEMHIRYNPHLDSQFVPDARGVQVLTDAHLTKARDLSGWTVQPLGAGRHLVQAKQLEAWYASPEPEPGVVGQARADFGDMILTLDAIKRHPPS